MNKNKNRLKELIHALVAEKLNQIESKNLSINDLKVSDDMTIGADVSFFIIIDLCDSEGE